MTYRLKQYAKVGSASDEIHNSNQSQKLSNPSIGINSDPLVLIRKIGEFLLGLAILFSFFYYLVPFLFSVITGSFFEYSEVENRHKETWSVLDADGQRAFVRMNDGMRYKIDRIPLDRRAAEIDHWWSYESSFCRYGSERRDGFKHCRTKAENDLGNIALDSLLNKRY